MRPSAATVVRLGLWTLIVLALGALSLGGWRLARRNAGSIETPRPIDGQHVENVRHVRYLAGEPVLRIAVGRGALRRPKLGVFRIGFARALVASDLAIDATIGDGTTGGLRAAEVGAALQDLFRTGGGDAPTITSVAVESVALTLRGRDGRTFALRADACSGGLATRGRLALQGNVVVETEGRAYAFTTLELDPESGAFVAATPRPEGGAPAAADPRPTERSLHDLNCAVDRLLSRHRVAGCGTRDDVPAGDARGASAGEEA